MALAARVLSSRTLSPPLLCFAPRLCRFQSSAALVPEGMGSSSEISTGRIRKKVRLYDPNASPPKTRGPPAIEDTWVMRLGDSTWYIVLGLLAGCTLWVAYEAQAGVRHRMAIGKKFFDQFEPEERAAQFNHPQSPFNEKALGTPNERYPFIIEETPRQPGEMPRDPAMLERIIAADSAAGRKKLADKREKMAAEARAKLEARRQEDEQTS